MNTLKQKPFAFSCCIFIALLILLFKLDLWLKAAIIALCLLSFFVFFSNKEKYRFILLYMIPPIIIACTVSIFFFSINYQNILTYTDKTYECEFVVTDENNVSDTYSSYVIRLQKINGKRVDFKANFSLDYKLDTPLFTSYSATLEFSGLKSYQDDSSPNFSFLSKGIYLGASPVNDITEHDTVKLFPSYYFKKINSFFSGLFDKNLDGEENSLIQAFILGNKNKLSKNTIYKFRVLGLSHMLAVSGMHLSILIGSLSKLLEKINISKKTRYILIITITFVYAGITGFSPSVKRAALMLIIYYSSFLISKNNDSITALCSSVAIICLISPNSIFDIGLWLSFLSTYGILQVALPIGEKLKERIDESPGIPAKWIIKLWSTLLYSIIPVMFSLPVVWLSYGELAILSPITNIIFTPLLIAIMRISPFAMIFSFIPFVSNILAFISHLCSHIMLILAGFLADYSPIVNIDYNFTYYIMAFLVTLLFWFAVKNIKNKTLYLVPFVLSVISFCICLGIYTKATEQDQKLIYSNTYAGESFLVISENKGLICDISGVSYPNVVVSEYYLGKNHITFLDSYVVTDYNGSGIQTLKNLTALTKVKNLYIPKARNYDEKLLEKNFSEFAQDNNILLNVYDIYKFNQINFYGITIDIKKVTNEAINSPSSVCVSFSNEKTSFNYISQNAYSTFDGYSLINDWFKFEENLIFGTYGKSVSVDTLPLLYKENKNLFFADNSLYTLYSKSIPDTSTVTVLKENFIFHFN